MPFSQTTTRQGSNVSETLGLLLGPGRRLQFMVLGGICLLGFGWGALDKFHDYRLAGSQPSTMTMADVREAAAIRPFTQRWVRLTEAVNFDCSHGVQWIEGGNVTEVVLAFDDSRQQPLWLEYEGAYSCETLPNIPLEGMLIEPEKFWAKHSMFAPSSPYPLMEIKVGRSPDNLLRDAEAMGGGSVLGALVLWLGYMSLPKKKAPSLLSPHAKVGP